MMFQVSSSSVTQGMTDGGGGGAVQQQQQQMSSQISSFSNNSLALSSHFAKKEAAHLSRQATHRRTKSQFDLQTSNLRGQPNLIQSNNLNGMATHSPSASSIVGGEQNQINYNISQSLASLQQSQSYQGLYQQSPTESQSFCSQIRENSSSSSSSTAAGVTSSGQGLCQSYSNNNSINNTNNLTNNSINNNNNNNLNNLLGDKEQLSPMNTSQMIQLMQIKQTQEKQQIIETIDQDFQKFNACNSMNNGFNFGKNKGKAQQRSAGFFSDIKGYTSNQNGNNQSNQQNQMQNQSIYSQLVISSGQNPNSSMPFNSSLNQNTCQTLAGNQNLSQPSLNLMTIYANHASALQTIPEQEISSVDCPNISHPGSTRNQDDKRIVFHSHSSSYSANPQQVSQQVSPILPSQQNQLLLHSSHSSASNSAAPTHHKQNSSLGGHNHSSSQNSATFQRILNPSQFSADQFTNANQNGLQANEDREYKISSAREHYKASDQNSLTNITPKMVITPGNSSNSKEKKFFSSVKKQSQHGSASNPLQTQTNVNSLSQSQNSQTIQQIILNSQMGKRKKQSSLTEEMDSSLKIIQAQVQKFEKTINVTTDKKKQQVLQQKKSPASLKLKFEAEKETNNSSFIQQQQQQQQQQSQQQQQLMQIQQFLAQANSNRTFLKEQNCNSDRPINSNQNQVYPSNQIYSQSQLNNTFSQINYSNSTATNTNNSNCTVNEHRQNRSDRNTNESKNLKVQILHQQLQQVQNSLANQQSISQKQLKQMPQQHQPPQQGQSLAGNISTSKSNPTLHQRKGSAAVQSNNQNQNQINNSLLNQSNLQQSQLQQYLFPNTHSISKNVGENLQTNNHLNQLQQNQSQQQINQKHKIMSSVSQIQQYLINQQSNNSQSIPHGIINSNSLNSLNSINQNPQNFEQNRIQQLEQTVLELTKKINLLEQTNKLLLLKFNQLLDEKQQPSEKKVNLQKLIQNKSHKNNQI
ncbi:hypothetical protein ABPG72_013796 [Tetrahymena utriculariae]